MSHQVLATFSRGSSSSAELSSFFATISKDNRIKIWKTSNATLQQHLTEPQHLGQLYTALTVHSGLASKKSSKDSQRILGTQSSNGYVAVGSKKGVISIWKLETGEIVHRLGDDGDLSQSQVNDLVFSQDCSKLYSANADGQVIEWDVDTGKVLRTLPLFQTSITKLALSSTDNLLLVGSSSVKLVDLSSGATVAEYSGHVSPITTMSFSLDDKLFAVGCEDDRFVNVWPVCNQDDMPVVQTKKKKRTASGSSSTLYNQPLVTLSLDSAPVHVTISTSTVAQSAKSKKDRKSVV